MINWYPLCHNSDGTTFCNCNIPNKWSQPDDPCIFKGRNPSPFAWTIFTDAYNPQSQSPLFSTIPKEVRDLIFAYALTDCTSNPPNRNNIFRKDNSWGLAKPVSDISTALLQTCRAVYLETYKLPIQLNGYVAWDPRRADRPALKDLAPWQFALIQKLSFGLQQQALEGDELARLIEEWKPKERSRGAYIAPRFYVKKNCDKEVGMMWSHNFGLVPMDEQNQGQDGDEISRPVNEESYYSDNNHGLKSKQRNQQAVGKAMVAKPLTHVRLHLGRTDWWTWTNPPTPVSSNINNSAHLSLDPALPTTLPQSSTGWTSTMLQLAQERRQGVHPVCKDGTWGAVIGRMPDLKVLELVLETFRDKRWELEVVVECAKTWRFRLEGGMWELVWDGRVEEANWVKSEMDMELDKEKGPPRQNTWYEKCTEFEVRIIRFKRQKVA